MRLKYTLTGKQLYEFYYGFAKDTAAKAHVWQRHLLGYSSIAAFGILCALFTASLERAFWLWWLSLLLVMLVNSVSRKITGMGYARYYERLPGVLDWEHRVVDGRLVTTNRKVETSFPIDSSAIVSKDAEFIYVEFTDQGRVRIPIAAFASAAQMAEFESLFSKPDTPNKSLQPTATAVTPPAGQEARQP